MKTLLAGLGFLGCSLTIAAQIEKGAMMIGGNGSAFYRNMENGHHFQTHLAPSFGYFPLKNWSVGGHVSGSFTQYRAGTMKESAFGSGLGLFSRYYVPMSEKLFLFGEIRGNAFATLKTGSSFSSPAYSFSPGAGLSYFLTRNIAVESTINYSKTPGSVSRGTLGLNLGFQIYLNRKGGQLRQRY